MKLNPVSAFRVTPPSGAPFFAIANLTDRDTIETYSNRDGAWKLDPKMLPVDLIMPEQEFNEWDIVEISLAELPPLPEGDSEKALAAKAAALSALNK